MQVKDLNSTDFKKTRRIDYINSAIFSAHETRFDNECFLKYLSKVCENQKLLKEWRLYKLKIIYID